MRALTRLEVSDSRVINMVASRFARVTCPRTRSKILSTHSSSQVVVTLGSMARVGLISTKQRLLVKVVDTRNNRVILRHKTSNRSKSHKCWVDGPISRPMVTMKEAQMSAIMMTIGSRRLSASFHQAQNAPI